MAVIQFPFCHSPIGNLKIFTKFLAVHACTFPQFFYFGFAVHFIYPIKQKYTLRIYYSIRQTNTQRVNLIYIKRLCQIPDTQERVAFLMPQTVYGHPSQSPASAKFMWDNGVLAGYDGVDIRSAMKHGTLAIGMLGMAETLQILIGKNQLDPYGMEVAKEICQLYKDRCEEFKNETSLNFGVYFTPAENLCFTAMTKFKEKYGEIPNVSDKKFFTNSVHVPVWEEVTPFEKIDVESQLDSYSSAGCILYTEFDATVKHNINALEML